MNDFGLTVFDLKKLKGKRKIKFVQVDTLEQAIAAKEAGIEMNDALSNNKESL